MYNWHRHVQNVLHTKIIAIQGATPRKIIPATYFLAVFWSTNPNKHMLKKEKPERRHSERFD